VTPTAGAQDKKVYYVVCGMMFVMRFILREEQRNNPATNLPLACWRGFAIDPPRDPSVTKLIQEFSIILSQKDLSGGVKVEPRAFAQRRNLIKLCEI
jgi:hypothetical protein